MSPHCRKKNRHRRKVAPYCDGEEINCCKIALLRDTTKRKWCKATPYRPFPHRKERNTAPSCGKIKVYRDNI
jgi:hypothetical protein